MQLNSAQRNALAQIGRQMDTVYAGGLAAFIQEQILNLLEASAAGIQSFAADIDSIAKGGGHFTWDEDGSSGLSFAWKTSRFSNGKALVTVPAGDIDLSASTTNYVEVDRAGTVSSNTTGFTSGRLPVFTVTTGTSSIVTVTSAKPLLTLIGSDGVDGSMLSNQAKQKEIAVVVGAVSATGSILVPVPKHAAKLAGVQLITPTAIATNDSNYWTFDVKNRGTDGLGTTDMLDTGTTNSTRATGGSSISSKIARNLTLHGTANNLDVNSGQALEAGFTKTGSATTMNGVVLAFFFTFTG